MQLQIDFSKHEEIWKPINGFSFYEISNLGRIKSLERWVGGCGDRVIGERIIACGGAEKYPSVTLRKNKERHRFYIHRLVAENFIPNPKNKPYVNHINSKSNDNRVENLEWVTTRENTNHREFINKRKCKRGAHYDKNNNTWIARVYVDGKQIRLGRFNTEDEAHNTYKQYLIDNNQSIKYV